MGYEGSFHYETDKPDGAPRKLSDVSRMGTLGWSAGVSLSDGLGQTYEWFRDHQAAAPNP